jgi:hypothetical protein
VIFCAEPVFLEPRATLRWDAQQREKAHIQITRSGL